jgi:hypothetical protein
MSGGKPLVVNGWTLFAHPIFLDQQVDAKTRPGAKSGYPARIASCTNWP